MNMDICLIVDVVTLYPYNKSVLFSGLYNDVLEQMSTFKNQAAVICGFLACQPQPTCLIAHNGHCFDFPLFQAELQRVKHTLPADTEAWCADSFEAFRVLDGLPAVPEWLAQKKEKRKQTPEKKSNDESAATSKVALTETGSHNDVHGGCNRQLASHFNKDGAMNSASLPETNSPGKRQAECIRGSDDASALKLPRSDPVPEFGSQPSVTDSELADAYDTIFPEELADATFTEAGGMQQSELEITPTKDTSSVPSFMADCDGPSLKQHVPVAVDLAERQRVARKLFVEGTDAPSLLDTSEHKPRGESTNSLHQPDTGAGEAMMLHQHEQADAQSTESNSSASHASPTSVSKAAVNLSSHVAGKSTSSSSSISSGSFGTASTSVPASSKKVSYKLSEIYKREFGCYPAVAHTAGDDCMTLLKLIVRKSEQFVNFVEQNAVEFDTVEPMY